MRVYAESEPRESFVWGLEPLSLGVRGGSNPGQEFADEAKTGKKFVNSISKTAKICRKEKKAILVTTHRWVTMRPGVRMEILGYEEGFIATHLLCAR